MTDGPGPTPDVPPGWASEQPPPYGQPQQGPWAAPGSAPGQPGGPAGQPGPGSYGPPPGGQYGGQPGYGQPYGSPYGGPPSPYGYYPQAPRPGIIPLRPLNLGEILDGAIRLIRSNPRVTLGLSAIVAAIAVLPSLIAQLLSLQSTSVLDDYEHALSSGNLALVIGGGLAVSLFATVLSFVAGNILTGILMVVLGRAVFGGRTTTAEAWRVARPRIWALLGLSLLKGLIIVVPLVIVVSLVVIVGETGGFDSTPARGALAVLTVPFILAWFAYYAFISTKLGLATSAVVLERRGATDSMRRSWQLVRGGSWRVFGILALTTIMTLIFGFVLQALFAFFGSAIGGLGNLAVIPIASLLGGIVSEMVTAPFSAGVHGALYADRRMRAEAFDLVLQTAAGRTQELGPGHATIDDFWHPAYAASAGAPGASPYGGPPTNPGNPGYGGPGYGGPGYGGTGQYPYGPQQ
ncbi:hypothetical protein Pth03_17090 [Planotetraspora thailandica]|uniref:DUF7847 domain-containing protein n=1 Tax=Planotetraspora thailandica TaxID=487172 RepID=A0A8J3UZ65_9ACTN|nr:hypothetical protein [Planotetraspora thailandica]GII53320.1 hypothetical protein Pth03_17090 [Planotetraspora thailandica]